MDLVERYLQAVGKLLPIGQRADILSELRSSLYDTLENEYDQPVSENDVAALLKRTGSPQEVAAAYYPAGQYLIGPQLYPLFRMVARIALIATCVVQIILNSISLIDSFSLTKLFSALIETAMTMAFGLGFLVAIFWAMQRLELKPEVEEFDPFRLPELAPEAEKVSYAGQIGAIVSDLVVLLVLGRILQAGGLAWIDGSLVRDPLLMPFLPLLISLTLANIVFNIFVMWQQEWKWQTRLAECVLNLVGAIVLLIVLMRHEQWLVAQGAPNLFESLNLLPLLLSEEIPFKAMHVSRAIFALGTVVMAAKTLASGIQAAQSWSRPRLGLPSEQLTLVK